MAAGPLQPPVVAPPLPPQQPPAAASAAPTAPRIPSAAAAGHPSVDPKNSQAGSPVVGKGPIGSSARPAATSASSSSSKPTPAGKEAGKALGGSGSKGSPDVQVLGSSSSKIFNGTPTQPIIVGQTSIRPIPPKSQQQQQASKQSTSRPIPPPFVSATAVPPPAPKSSLRDYRKPKPGGVKVHQQPTALFSQGSKRPAAGTGVSPIPPKKGKPDATAGVSNIYQHLPRGLTITETTPGTAGRPSFPAAAAHLQQFSSAAASAAAGPAPPAHQRPLPAGKQSASSSSSSRGVGTNSSNGFNNLQMLPVLNIPGAATITSSSRRSLPTKADVSTLTSPAGVGGHPGLPNGLLRMANTSMQQPNAPPKVATKIVPKDLKSQLALSKIGLLEDKPGAGDPRFPPMPLASSTSSMKPPSIMAGRKPTLINMSMAQNVANALKFPPLIPPHVVRATSKSKSSSASAAGSAAAGAGGIMRQQRGNNNQGSPQKKSGSASAPVSKGNSPTSSKSSSRSSSLSPREGQSASSSSSAKGSKSSSPGGSSKPATKRIKPNQPLIPWSARHGGVKKNCSGWSWVGEGYEQRVDLNVSRICIMSLRPT